MTTNTDIAKLAADALAAATTPERVREIVEREIGKTVETAIRDSVRSYSSFGKTLSDKLSEALSINDLKLPTYNQMMTDLVQRLVQQHVADTVGARLEEDLKAILGIAPKTIRLSEIAAAMRENHDGQCGEVITCHAEEHDNTDSDDFWGPKWRVYLDDRKHHTRPKDASIRVEISHGIRDKSGPAKSEITTGKIWRIECDGRTATTNHNAGWHGTFRRPDRVYGLAERLLAYYAAGTIIEMDVENVVTSVGDY